MKEQPDNDHFFRCRIAGIRFAGLVMFAFATSLWMSGTSFCRAQNNGKPNIILILADDLGWADPGYQGLKPAGFHETPNIDRLAAEGMVFNRFYPSAANCAPTRACLITGMYAPRHHVYLPQGFARGWRFPESGTKYPPMARMNPSKLSR